MRRRFANEAGHLAVLDDVDAEIARRARIAPHHRVVARGAAAPLQQAAADREARVVEIEERQPCGGRAAASSSSASTPCMRMALPRRA